MPADWPAFLREIRDTEERWRDVDRENLPPHSVPYLPYPPGDFILLLAEALLAADSSTGGRALRFLDAGCGPGTKMRIAERFGLDAEGIDCQQALVNEANRGRARPWASVADVTTWDRYGQFDIVNYYRPVDGQAMPAAEQHVMTCIRPGAILIHVQGITDPATLGWQWLYSRGLPPVVTGVWRKPALTATALYAEMVDGAPPPALDPAALLRAAGSLYAAAAAQLAPVFRAAAQLGEALTAAASSTAAATAGWPAADGWGLRVPGPRSAVGDPCGDPPCPPPEGR
jgi:hypothetical protein